MSMRAWQVQEHGSPKAVLTAVELEPPQPGPGEARVRVAAAAVGLPDVFMCHGSYPLTPGLPFVAGQEVCGIVDAVGDGVDLTVGARVMGVTSFFTGRGGFAESAIVLGSSTYAVPDTMSSTSAAAFLIGYSTAWTGLVHRAELKAGEWLVVLGAAGGSGVAAVQLGRALGARVIAVASGDEKRALCERLGADVVIDRSKQSVGEAIRGATDGGGANVVYDPVGGAIAAEALQATASFGRFLAVGFASGEWLQVDAGDLVMSNKSVIGFVANSGPPEEQIADQKAMVALAADGALEPVVTVVPFAELPDAVDAVATGQAAGKLVIDVASTLTATA